MPLSRPQRNAKRLIASLQGNQPIPPDVEQWLAQGLDAYLHDRVSLDVALGLCQPSQRHPATVEAMEVRDTHLRCAADLIGGEPWPCAVALAARVRRFESCTWPRWREGENLPADPIDRELVQAFRARPSVPATAAGLQNIMRG